MSLFEDTNPRELKELLAQIHSGEAVLPDFQRDFVWDSGDTRGRARGRRHIRRKSFRDSRLAAITKREHSPPI